MPFKLKLKKSRQYNVKTKNVLVISVEMLDNTVVECTLSSHSLGKECLASLCQRLGLQQPEFFGLKYLSKYGSLWWVDLERPLKKQLDRYAQESLARLHLGVLFFVNDVTLLRDEVTRNFFFLQLKADFVEGNLKCSAEEAVMLAGFSLQAEFSDHDPERHTTEYLTNFAILPKSLISSKEAREALLERVILAHRELKGLTTSLAEIYYIAECKNLQGYGQQIFSTKDHAGSILYIGASMRGIFLRGTGSSCQVVGGSTSFRWPEIVNLVHHRRHFGIECHQSDKSVQCHLEDIDVAKYVWKMCAKQHRFYNGQRTSPFLKNHVAHNESSIPSYSVNPDNSNQLLASQESLDELGVYHTEEGYDELVERRMTVTGPEEVRVTLVEAKESTGGPEVRYRHQKQIGAHQRRGGFESNSYSNSLPQRSSASQQQRSSSTEVDEVVLRRDGTLPTPPPLFNSDDDGPGQMGSDSHLARSSVGDSRLGSVSELVQGLGEYGGGRRVTLPSYRQAPDYETAIRHKYGMQSSSVGDVSVTSGSYAPRASSLMTDSLGSLPGGGGGAKNPHPQQLYSSHYRNYVDLSHIDSCNSISETRTPINANGLHPNSMLHSNLVTQPPTQTWSTPELHSTRSNLSNDQLLASIQSNSYHPHHPHHPHHHHPHHQHQAPPAYPFKIQSTPDLTLNRGGHLSNRQSGGEQAPYVQRTISESRVVPPPPVLVKPPPPYGANNNANTVNYNNNYVTSSLGRDKRQDTTTTQGQGGGGRTSSPSMGPMLVAAMNGLTLSPPDVPGFECDSNKPLSRDSRIQLLESRLAEGQFFLEFERIPKRKPTGEFTTALLPENGHRNRFRDVLPYEDNRVRLTPTKDNPTGYINASRISVSVGNSQRFYIAAQGPLPSTVHSFWQMVWEQQVSLIVSLTETQENGKEKCHPYWPQTDHAAIRVNEFQISRSFSVSSSTYVTCSLTLNHAPSRSQRSVWHIQYTDWPDHRSPQDLQGFLSFMEEIDAVRRLASNEVGVRGRNSPVLVHCSAGVGRSGVTILADIMLYALDNAQETLDMAKLLTQLRYQRMLTIQTLAQYKFVYSVLIQYLKNSRLI